MPICERDPWRFQFFENVPCPDDLNIPTDDLDCWPWLPRHRWVYDRLVIAQSQGIACAPHGVMPQNYPVFSKPIINLRGMGIGSRVITSMQEMQASMQAGHFWMELLEGPHISTDCAIVQGEIRWLRHATGVPAGDGMFAYWTIHAAEQPELRSYLQAWTLRHLADYTGMINVETIGGRIIEMHLRFADQWCDLYGAGWVQALIRLYATGQWQFNDENRVDGYSVPLFAGNGQSYRMPSPSAQAHVRSLPHVSSLQVTFYPDRPEADHAMPPKGFRLGIINCTNLEAGIQARLDYARAFPGLHFLIPEPPPRP